MQTVNKQAKNRQAKAPLIPAFLCAFILGCAPMVQIESNKEKDYSADPKRFYVLSSLERELGASFSSAFHKKMAEIIGTCGAAMDSSQVTSLELNMDSHYARMDAFNADLILTILPAGGVKDEFGRVVNVRYDIRIQDHFSVPPNKIVWRASANNISAADGGEGFAIILTDKMKADRMFRSACAVTKP